MSKNKPLFQQGIIKQLANKYNVPEEEVEKAVYHQYKFTVKIMKKGDFESVRIPRWGKFHVNPNRLKQIKQRENE